MSVETPNGAEFSLAAKLYLCSGRLIDAGSFMFMHITPTGESKDIRTVTESIIAAQVEWLIAQGWVDARQGEAKIGFANVPVVFMTPRFAGAPGFAGRMLEATGWKEADLISIMQALMGGQSQVPYERVLEAIKQEYRDAGILHGGGWNAEWRDYLLAAWLPEMTVAWQRIPTIPYVDVVKRDCRHASAILQRTPDDD